MFQFAIALKDVNKVICSIEIMEQCDVSGVRDAKEIGCLLSENYRGKGIMTEAVMAVVKYCMECLKASSAIAGYFEPKLVVVKCN